MRRPRWTGSTALVRVRRRVTCLDCHARLRVITWSQPALVWVHGYGYTERVTILVCPACPYRRHVETTAVRPGG